MKRNLTLETKKIYIFIFVDFLNDSTIIPPQKKLEIIKNNSLSNQEQLDIKSNILNVEDEEKQIWESFYNTMGMNKSGTVGDDSRNNDNDTK